VSQSPNRSTACPSVRGSCSVPGYIGLVNEQRYPEAVVDGFTMGMFVSYDDCGDAWVKAPDGSIGTLIWETGSPSYFEEKIAPDPNGRWGTYAVQLPLPLTTDGEAADYLRALLPELRRRWESWTADR
jgi:hypothetical protein